MAASEEIGNGEEVSLALRHLLVLHQQMPDVLPVTDEGLAGTASALGDLVLVVGEDEILTATMDVERLAKVLHAHSRALDVPARATPAEGRVPMCPLRLIHFGLPEHEVTGVFLFVLVGVDASPRLYAGCVQSREPAAVR